METICRIPVADNCGNIILQNVDSVEQLRFNRSTRLSIDGSTTITGVSFIDAETRAYVGSIAFKRNGETPVQYKVKFKKALEKILENNRESITTVYYEEPFIEYVEAAKNLLMLRTSVEELIAEHDGDLDYITYKEINNKKWKKRFLMPDKCPTGTDLEKKAVRDKMVKYINCLSEVTQDEIDATAMGMVAVGMELSGLEDEIASTKKATPFKYEVYFTASNSDQEFLEDFEYLVKDAKVPKKVLENGIELNEIDGKGIFKNKVYRLMGDNDMLLIIKFSTKTNCNVILENKIGDLTTDYDYIYAFVWRKSRKKSY